MTAVASLAVLIVLSAASVGLVLAQRAALVESLDEALDARADAVADRLRSGRPVAGQDVLGQDLLVEVVDADGTVLAASPDLEGRLPAGPRPEGESRITVELPGNGEPARLLLTRVGSTTVRVAASLEDVRDSTAALAQRLLMAVPLSAVVLAAVVWWAVGRTLRPVEAIRARVDQITGAQLDQRVPEPATDDEIARLARTMNAMLDRLQESAERQRRFVADASHELRSPLARIRTELEVDRAHPDLADPAGTSASVLAETVGLQRLVDDLLLLARGDAGALGRVEPTPVDLDEVVEGLVSRVRRTDGAHVDGRGVAPVQVLGDRSQLERAVANLLDNAVRHAREQVVVTLREAPGGRAELIVQDDGPGIPPDQRERIFQRFTRLDEARSMGDGGAGLGLAIAREIAERHGGTLTLGPGDRPGATFVLALPTAQNRANPRVGRSGRG